MNIRAIALLSLILSRLALADAPKPSYDLSTPRSAYAAYLNAYYAASEEGMRATTTGGDLAFSSALSARLAVQQWQRLSDVAVQKFGPDAATTIRAPDFSARKLEAALKKIDTLVIQEKGDVATIASEGVELLKENGQWRKNLRDLQGTPDEHFRDDYYQWLAKRNKAMLDAWTKLAAQVSDGRYATAAEVKAAMQKAIAEIDNTLTPPTPTTNPSSTPATRP